MNWCSARLQNKGNLQRQKHQGHSQLQKLFVKNEQLSWQEARLLATRIGWGLECLQSYKGGTWGHKVAADRCSKTPGDVLGFDKFQRKSAVYRCRNKKRLGTQWLSFFVFQLLLISL